MANAQRGHFVWFELLARDVKAAIAYYGHVMGWTTQVFEESDYIMFVGSQGPLGGVMALSDEVARQGMPSHWMSHVQVDDVDATVARAQKMGGRVHREPADIPTVGRFSVLADPQGAAISVFTPTQAMARHDVQQPGEFCWSELMSSDAAAGARFYTELFGWKVVQEMDMGPVGTYRVFGLGEEMLGGMMKLPPGVPISLWLYYVETADLDAAIGRATAGGGRLLTGPVEVPGGSHIAQLIDPQGAPFALHSLKR